MWTAEKYATWGRRLMLAGGLATAITVSLGVKYCNENVRDGMELARAQTAMLKIYSIPIGLCYSMFGAGVWLRLTEDETGR